MKKMFMKYWTGIGLILVLALTFLFYSQIESEACRKKDPIEKEPIKIIKPINPNKPIANNQLTD